MPDHVDESLESLYLNPHHAPINQRKDAVQRNRWSRWPNYGLAVKQLYHLFQKLRNWISIKNLWCQPPSLFNGNICYQTYFANFLYQQVNINTHAVKRRFREHCKKDEQMLRLIAFRHVLMRFHISTYTTVSLRNHEIASMPVKQPWRMWVDTSCKYTTDDHDSHWGKMKSN